MINTTVLDTPIGPLALLVHEGTLVAAGFTPDPAELRARLPKPLREQELITADLGEIAKAHEAYFDGDLSALENIPVAQYGTSRLEQLWATLREVAPGETVTYGELADRAGMERAARAAGQACAKNLVAPAVPCHRVLRAGGDTGDYAYGADRKAWLLRHEALNNS
jgi:methylated-DNA-[protein]-cysteine S-methyltransferase